MTRRGGRRLEFKSGGGEDFLNAALKLVDEGAERFILRPWNEVAAHVARGLRSKRAAV